jgi:hypothetical protein
MGELYREKIYIPVKKLSSSAFPIKHGKREEERKTLMAE